MSSNSVTSKAAAIDVRPFASLGKANHGWLEANHHFSFAGYYDPERMGHGNIRVWNDDDIAAQSGFPPHSHDNMEIITYVREGAITHRDSMGNVGRTKAGDVQVMSAGTGVQHSEFNLEDVSCRLFQIWILPRERNVRPHWDQKEFLSKDASGFTVLASGYDDDKALAINADARVFGAKMAAGESIHHVIKDDRHAYLVVSKGRISIGNTILSERDGVAISAGNLQLIALDDAEVVMVDSA
ncbi:pirin family protein [Sphingorhabdus arenilitoris]|uniref:Pirin family protein n=1 Tax=Sphingorhabdus arenilitoris TaxID=1490041 RepID=A0ABV8RHE9_9SPHN